MRYLIVVLALFSVPATAFGVGDLAKTVLNGSSILKKGQEKCGASLGITTGDSLAMTLARAAVEKTVPLSKFTALDDTASTNANTAAQSATFCNETKAKKPNIMGKIIKAGKAILKVRGLGGLGL